MVKLHFILLFFSISLIVTAQNNINRTDSTDTHVFYPVKVFAEYPGGVSEMMNFIYRNLKWPVGVGEICIEGRVVLRFTVEKDGVISNIRVLRSLHEYLDKEAIRVVELMPNWIPAELDGQVIESEFTLPVLFRVSK